MRRAALAISALKTQPAPSRQNWSTLGVEPVARTAEEIARRLREKATDPAPESGVSSVLASYLDLVMPGADSADGILQFARESGVELDAALEGYNERLSADRQAAAAFLVGRRVQRRGGPPLRIL